MDETLKHVYLVDDDAPFRKSLVRLLTSAGYSAESFSSAQSFLHSGPVPHKTGVLILDLRMPGMNGFELQKRVNKLASRLQIVIITGDAQPGDHEHAINSGAIGFLEKPFEEDSLLELIGPAMKPRR